MRVDERTFQLSSNNRAASGQKRRRHLAKSAMICNRLGRDRSLFAATALPLTNLLRPCSWCWRNQNDAPRASPLPHRAEPACRDHPRSGRSLLLSLRPYLKLSRSFLLGHLTQGFWLLRLLFLLVLSVLSM